MYFAVKIFDKNGKLKKVVSAKSIQKEANQTFHDMSVPNYRKSKNSKHKAVWGVYTCRNCGVRVKSKKDTAVFCSVYCTGYWTKYVKTHKKNPFRTGGLDHLPHLKLRLASVIASRRIFIKDEYKPIRLSDV